MESVEWTHKIIIVPNNSPVFYRNIGGLWIEYDGADIKRGDEKPHETSRTVRDFW